MTFTKTLLSSLGLALMLATPPGAAQAQTLSRILAKSGLSPEDFNLMNAAARSLYETGSPSVGKSANWKNEGTGSFGSVRLTAVQSGCVQLAHETHPKGGDKITRISDRVCKTEDGKWISVP